jgi:hypothetical protein
MAILTVVLLTIVLAGSFTRVSAGARVGDDDAAKRAAFGVAAAGPRAVHVRARDARRHRRGAHRDGGDGADQRAGRVRDVELRRVRAQTATTTALYAVRSRGVSTAHALPGTPPATHTVAQYAYWYRGKTMAGAIVDLAGLLKHGSSGTINGFDACLSGVGGPKAGAAVPTNGFNSTGSLIVPVGAPNILDLGTHEQAVNSVPIDWVSVMANTGFAPDVTLPGGTWPTATAFAAGWPVIRVGNGPTEEFTLPSSGRGLLIVSGNLRISGNTNWDGLILVGGTLKASGAMSVDGGVITGLANKLPGYTVPPSDVLNGNISITYNSCKVASAQSKFWRIVAIGNAWSDLWPES